MTYPHQRTIRIATVAPWLSGSSPSAPGEAVEATVYAAQCALAVVSRDRDYVLVVLWEQSPDEWIVTDGWHSSIIEAHLSTALTLVTAHKLGA